VDNRLQLPAADFSYLLHGWDQSLCVEQSLAQSRATVARILNRKRSVDSLRAWTGRWLTWSTTSKRSGLGPTWRPRGDLVTSADSKGIVLRRSAGALAPVAHRCKGDEANPKRMATVGTPYTIDRYRLTPEQVVAPLSCDGLEPGPRP
jgi:hypothetical protein